MSGATKWVFRFDELEAVEAHVGGDPEKLRGLLGGKGASLAGMSRLGVPVPPGFTVTAEACNAFLAADGAFPEGMWEQELTAIKAIEKASGRRFGSPEAPLLVSCRSGSKFSMPGMMDTILNVGLNDEVAEAMAAQTGDARFAYDLYRRLMQMMGSIVLGIPSDLFEARLSERRETAGVENDTDLSADDWREVVESFRALVRTYTGSDFPSDPYGQLELATAAVFRSWNGRRARDYREATGIAYDLGTAVSVQAMVF